MTRKEARELLPIIQEFAEGKTIEVLHPNGGWTESDKVYFNLPPNHYRIKEEPKYRPFKNQEECWNEMHKHPDFGWLTRIDTGAYTQIPVIFPYCIIFDSATYNYEKAFEYYTFADGTPFGILEEE